MQSVHLIILIHGLYGVVANLAAIRSELEEQGRNLNPLIATYITTSFTGSHTWDGIDVNAHRAAKEIDVEVERLADEAKDVVAISIVMWSCFGPDGQAHLDQMGYSLGGHTLWVYYIQDRPRSSKDIDQLHSRRSQPPDPEIRQRSSVRPCSTTNTIVHTIGRRLFSRSGQQMYCIDKGQDGRCLLDVMADPGTTQLGLPYPVNTLTEADVDRIFLQALSMFPRIMIVANGCNDSTVPFPTAAISLDDPFENYDTSGIVVDEDEDHVVKSWHMPGQEEVVIAGGEARVLKRRPRFPPFLLLPLPWPFKYLLLLLFPLLVPLVLIWTMRLHDQLLESRPSFADQSATSLLRPTSPIQQSEPRDESFFIASSSSFPHDGTETPPLTLPPDQGPPQKSRVPLLLTPHQKAMIASLNDIPQMERMIAWFPTAYNSHAVIIVRDLNRFAWHEEGRGV
ncbi:MAG: hypothetical protein TREMPRED_003411, partial [Tremellales sp. Tagirdzhanova-0007]